MNDDTDRTIIMSTKLRLGHYPEPEDYKKAYGEVLNEIARLTDLRMISDGGLENEICHSDRTFAALKATMYESRVRNQIVSRSTETHELTGLMTFYDRADGIIFAREYLDEDHLAIISSDVKSSPLFSLLRKARVASFFHILCYELGEKLYQDPDYEPSVGRKLYQFNENHGPNVTPIHLQVNLINLKNGEMNISNAGDNWVHFWDEENGDVNHLELYNAKPIDSIFTCPGMEIDNPTLSGQKKHMSEFGEYKYTIPIGNIIIYLNDGLQNSRRYYRNERGEITDYCKLHRDIIKADFGRYDIGFPLEADENYQGSRGEQSSPYVRSGPSSFVMSDNLSTNWPIGKQIFDLEEFIDLYSNGKLPFRFISNQMLMFPRPKDKYEIFGSKRVFDIVEAVMNRGVYILKCLGEQNFDFPLEFDFSDSKGSLKEIVLAVFSIERLFRVRPDSNAGEKDLIKISTSQVDFLKRHFANYERVFLHEKDKDVESNTNFSHIREEKQNSTYSLWLFRR